MPGVAIPDAIKEIDTGDETRVQKIPPYKVIFLNDDITTMDFVVHVLITVFKKDHQTAFLRQHQVHAMARSAGYPLRCILEPA
jgi:ATP-dependent Clp protease adaptor protein ClpS